eukprot:6795024-Pyramimonas_sp.AAC.1
MSTVICSSGPKAIALSAGQCLGPISPPTSPSYLLAPDAAEQTALGVGANSSRSPSSARRTDSAHS